MTVRNWHWVPTSINVADDATRGISMSELCTGRWCTGPEFLSSAAAEWPADQKPEDDTVDTTDMKSEFLAATAAQPTEVYKESLPDGTRFSSYNRLVRASAWVLRFVKNVCAKKNSKPLEL